MADKYKQLSNIPIRRNHLYHNNDIILQTTTYLPLARMGGEAFFGLLFSMRWNTSCDKYILQQNRTCLWRQLL